MAPPAAVKYLENWGQFPLLDGWDGPTSLQLAGDFMGLGYAQVLFINRSGQGGRVMIADFSSGAPPATVKYWENWGQFPLLDGWDGPTNLQLAGDFMGLGYAQALFINRSGQGGRVMIADFSSGAPPATVKHWEDWGQFHLLDGFDNPWCLQRAGDFASIGNTQVLFINRSASTPGQGRVLVADFVPGTNISPPIEARYYEKWGESSLFDVFQDSPNLQLAGDLMGLRRAQMLFINRSGHGGRVLIADYTGAKSPVKVMYQEEWGQSSLLDGWHDPDDLLLVGDFMGLGHAQVLFINRSGQGGRVMIADFSSPTITENHLWQGSACWQISEPAMNHEIEGFASSTSVIPGESLDFFVNTVAPSFRMEIFRMGWYQNLGGRRMLVVDGLAGISQPAPSVSADGRQLIECPWSVSYTLTVPNSWPSGVYLTKLEAIPYTKPDGTVSPSYESYIIFVVRNDDSTSPLIFQLSVNTYQAYNGWGGNDLYGDGVGSRALRANAVSFNRPYDRAYGSGDFFWYDYSMLRWLEKNGYDVTYITDVDTHLYGQLLLKHKVFLSVGHNEYWSWEMRDAVESALKQGVSLCFFGANAMYWQVRFEGTPLGRTIVCYKVPDDGAIDPLSGIDDARVTARWRDPLLGRPEQELIGQMYRWWLNFYTPPYFFDFVAANTRVWNSTGLARLWPFVGTSLIDGSRVPNIVGVEFDNVHDFLEDRPVPVQVPTGLIKLAESTVNVWDFGPLVSNTTLYTAPSGAGVFAAGSMIWSWGLEDDDFNAGPWWAVQNRHNVSSVDLQRLTANVLIRFIRGNKP